jgi:hypothetical protein
VTHHPPPAPDWILGEDGHWRPPPFDTGQRPRPVPPSPPPGPGPGPGPGRSDRGRRMGLGVVGLVLVVAGIGFKVADGMSIIDKVRDETKPSWQKTLDDEAAAEDQHRAALADAMASEDRTVLGPGGDDVCPEVEWVGRMTDQLVPQEIVREGVERSINGVDVSGIECRYGEHIRVGKLHGFEDRVDALMASGGPIEVREGPFPGSVRFDDPAAGRATIVFEDDEQILEAFVQLPIDIDNYLISLADLTLN